MKRNFLFTIFLLLFGANVAFAAITAFVTYDYVNQKYLEYDYEQGLLPSYVAWQDDPQAPAALLYVDFLQTATELRAVVNSSGKYTSYANLLAAFVQAQAAQIPFDPHAFVETNTLYAMPQYVTRRYLQDGVVQSEVVLVGAYTVKAGESIQAAIAAVASGDTIVVEPGIYEENLNFMGKNITLRSTDPEDPAVVAATIIDGGGAGPVVTFATGETAAAVLTGFTLKGGSGQPGGDANETCGGGIYIIAAAPTIVANVIEANSADWGAGIFIDQDAEPLIQQNTIKANTATNGGGGIYVDQAAPVIKDNTIELNTAERGAGLLLATGAQALVEVNTISGNQAIAYGGGVYCYAAHATLKENTVAANKAEKGAGITLRADANTTLIANTITQNEAVAADHAFGGGVLAFDGTTAVIEGNDFGENTADTGGGMAVSGANPTIRANTFSTNQAQWGGGLYLYQADATLEANTFGANTAERGGAIFIETSAPTLTDNEIIGNTAAYSGGAIMVFNAAQPLIDTNNISANTAKYGAGVMVEKANPAILNNVIDANAASVWGGGIYLASEAVAVIDGNNIINNEAYWGGGIFVSPDSSVKFADDQVWPRWNRPADDGVVWVCRAETVTARVTLKDYSDSIIPNVDVFLSITPGDIGVINEEYVNNGSTGIADFTFTATAAGPVTFTATAKDLEGLWLAGQVSKSIEIYPSTNTFSNNKRTGEQPCHVYFDTEP